MKFGLPSTVASMSSAGIGAVQVCGPLVILVLFSCTAYRTALCTATQLRMRRSITAPVVRQYRAAAHRLAAVAS